MLHAFRLSRRGELRMTHIRDHPYAPCGLAGPTTAGD
eukprot:gene18270-37579_t